MPLWPKQLGLSPHNTLFPTPAMQTPSSAGGSRAGSSCPCPCPCPCLEWAVQKDVKSPSHLPSSEPFAASQIPQ